MELILGSAQASAGYGILSGGRSERRETSFSSVIRMSEELGFGAIDTAPVYGLAEKIIGDTETHQQVHTKLRPGLDFETSLRRSLQDLGRDQVEVLYLHDASLLSCSDKLEQGRLLDLMENGANSLGASVYEFEDFQKARFSGLFRVIQVPMNALDTRFQGIGISDARREGIKVYARSVFLQGVLLAEPSDLPGPTRNLAPYVRRLRRLCVDWEVDLIDALTQFVIQRTEVDGIILGASTTAELQQISKAFVSEVPSGLLDQIEAFERPEWAMTDPRVWK